MALEQRRFAWQQRRRPMRAIEQCAYLTQARGDLDWMADLPAQRGQQILRHLDAAYDNWHNPDHRAGAPVRRKRMARMSVPFPGQAVGVMRLNHKWGAVRLPKLAWVRFRWSRALGGAVRNATVTADGTGRWHVSFGVAAGTRPALPNSELRVVPAPGTSQTCATCKVRDPRSRPGCGRVFACTACGHTEHADKNAAIEIEDRARRADGPNSTRRHPAVPSPRETGRRMREPLAGAA